MKSKSQNGVALVITLIMLSLITFLTVTFLAISGRERSSVTGAINETQLNDLVNAAAARAQAEVVSRMMARSNMFAYDLTVSRSFSNPAGFNAGNDNLDTNNVNFDYTTSGAPLSQAALIRNIANLYFDPRVPVFMRSNTTVAAAPMDFRYYVDFNRNGQFETNGFIGLIRTNREMVFATNNLVARTNMVGDPEWIGVLENPSLPHSGSNRFIGRYAYLVLPAGKTLDVNYIHNYAKHNFEPGTFRNDMPLNADGYQRNHGIGPWEINLAAFLAEINTNVYVNDARVFGGNAPYQYNPFRPGVTIENRGWAFSDALSILRHRYETNMASLASTRQLFGNPNAIGFDGIDAYSSAPLDFNRSTPPFRYDANNIDDPDRVLANNINARWAGADNPSQFEDISEILDTNRVSPDMVRRLRGAGTSRLAGSYDRYTFYRLLSQLGTDGAIDHRPRMHLNYRNDPNNPLDDSATNQIAWDALSFFTNAAATLIRQSIADVNGTNYFEARPVGTNFGLHRIQIWPLASNQYTPNLHRMLQLAANMLEYQTNRQEIINEGRAFPHVFRPIIEQDANGIYITGYRLLDPAPPQGQRAISASAWMSARELDLTNSADRASIPSIGAGDDGTIRSVAGIPLIIGAKKGWPNFNEFSSQSAAYVSRKLQFLRTGTARPHRTNELWVFAISNMFGVETWLSYTQRIDRPLQVRIQGRALVQITNQFGAFAVPPREILLFTNINVTSGWEGRKEVGDDGSGMRTFVTNVTMLPVSRFMPNGGNGALLDFRRPNYVPGEESGSFLGFHVPQFYLSTSNYLRVAIIDMTTDRIIDYVSLRGTEFSSLLNIYHSLNRNPVGGPPPAGGGVQQSSLWDSNRVGGSVSANVPTLGLLAQIDISMRGVDSARVGGQWRAYNGSVDNPSLASAAFRKLIQGQAPETFTAPAFFAPYEPTAAVVQRSSWQANDPFVHYTVNDLIDPQRPPNDPEFKGTPLFGNAANNPFSTDSVGFNIGKINQRYKPWGFPDDTKDGYNFVFKDPQIRRSDDWQFPSNAFNPFPTIGWIGRVHRGTPWQTVFLKTPYVTPGPTGGFMVDQLSHGIEGWNGRWVNSYWLGAGSDWTYPTNDWRLLDGFTVAPNRNATRGLLSVNQSGAAAWSAVLCGAPLLTNTSPEMTVGAFFTNTFVEPGSPAIYSIVNGINRWRDLQTNKVFNSIGDILQAPELTFASPALRFSPSQVQGVIPDAAYESIPENILSLLKLGDPRFVVYSFAQTLKPAENSIVTSTKYFNLCTNYQVMGERATKTIFRVEGTPDRPRIIKESFQVLRQ